MTKFSRNDIEPICCVVAKVVKTEDEARELLLRLAKTPQINWTRLIAEAAEEQRKLREQDERDKEQEEIRNKLYEPLRNAVVICPLCWKKFPNHELESPCPLLKGGWQRNIPRQYNKRYCPTCREKIIKRYTDTCVVCSNDFITSNSEKACPACWWKAPGNLEAQVDEQRGRARRKNLLATLSVIEWRAAVEDFQGMCAYCLWRPMEALDHFIPIKHYGGTTTDNCVPSCPNCNKRKGDLNPNNEFDLLHLYLRMSTKRIERVRTYLDSKKPIQQKTQTE